MSFLGDLFSTPADVATSILDRVPGGGWVKDAYNQGQTWILAAVQTPMGGWMIDVVTNSVGIPALLPIVGPAATALWAVPGLAKGEPFTQAYVEGFSKRLVQLAQYLAGQGASEAVQKQAADAMSSQVQQIANDPNVQSAMGQIARQQSTQAIQDALVQAHLTPEEIASRFGARPDAAVMALNALLHQQVYDPRSYDIATGQPPIPVERLENQPLQPSAAYLIPIQIARAAVVSLQQAAGLPGASPKKLNDARLKLQQLTQLYEAALAQENQNKDATYYLTQLLLAQKAGAPPDQIAVLQTKYQTALSKDQTMQGGLAFRLGAPLTEGFGKPDGKTILVDMSVLLGVLYVLDRLRR
jgi:hypothetical protein